MQILSNPISALNICASLKFSRLKGNLGRGTRWWRQILERKWKYDRFAHAQCTGHNYWNSSFIMDVTMGQIPRSTERISSSCMHLQRTSEILEFLPCRSNSQASTQTLSRREHNGLQQTSWKQRYFETKPCFLFEVPLTAALRSEILWEHMFFKSVIYLLTYLLLKENNKGIK